MPPILRTLKPIHAVALAWVLLSTLFVWRAWNKDFLALFSDTDDATRLVVVRDFIGGQNWFDHVQHRFNTPFGAEIHWSRLIDLPLGWLITLFNLFAPGQGERIALFVWPLLWLLPALWLTTVLVRRLCGPGHDLAALVLAVLAVPVFSEFVPGRIDHHNVQAVLILWLAIEAVAAPRSNAAAFRAGIAAATSLAIGAETLIIIAFAIIAFGLHWVIDKEFAPRLWRFGAAFAGAMLVHFLLAVGPAEWFAVQCDANSIVYLLASFGIALVFAGLIHLPLLQEDWGKRLAAGAAGAVLVAAVLLEFFPACAAGPFAGLEPWLRLAWLDHVVEARPLWQSLFSLPAFSIAVALPPLLAFGAVLSHVSRNKGPEAKRWLTYALLLAGGAISLILQLRGVRLAALLAVPGAVQMLAILRARYIAQTGRSKAFAAAALIGGWLASGGLVVFTIAGLVFPSAPTGKDVSPFTQCLSQDGFSAIAGLSPGRVAAPIDLGPYLLLMTPHAVIGSPYHRNGAGIGDTFRIFGGAEQQARNILRRRGIDLIVTCDALTGLSGGTLDAPDSLGNHLGRGEVPDWLKEIATPAGPLKIYRVAR